MPQSPSAQPASETPVRVVIINLNEDPTPWIRQIQHAIERRPAEIQVQFMGGGLLNPWEVVALRNALLQIPEDIRLVTIALGSLPPLSCAAWLVGDERRIATDAVVWVPNLPTWLLRNGRKGSLRILKHYAKLKDHIGTEFATVDATPERESEEGGEEEAEESWGKNNAEDHGKVMRHARTEESLRAIADVMNEWFPSWEFAGNYLSFSDLLDWGVVEPEWGFGGAVPKKGRQPKRAGAAALSQSAESPENCPKPPESEERLEGGLGFPEVRSESPQPPGNAV